MSFTYTANIPLSGQTLNVTKNPINSNFQAINQLVAVNHVGFGLTGLGKHNMCELVNQAAIPSPLAAGEGTLYTKTGSQLFYTPDNTGTQYQLTTVDETNKATFGTNTNYIAPATTLGGWTFLPGNLIMQYGFIVPTHNPGTTTVTFPVSFGSATNVYSVQITAKATNAGPADDQTAAVRSINASGASFLASTSSSGNVTGFWWIAIGIHP